MAEADVTTTCVTPAHDSAEREGLSKMPPEQGRSSKVLGQKLWILQDLRRHLLTAPSGPCW